MFVVSKKVYERRVGEWTVSEGVATVTADSQVARRRGGALKYSRGRRDKR